jgi:hypothetical protein
MAKYVTIGYGDREGYDRTHPDIRDAAHAHDARLQSEGVLIGVAGKPTRVRNHDASGIKAEDGPFMSFTLPVAGFAVIEAATHGAGGGDRLADPLRCRPRCRRGVAA